ncbi:putative ferredoxin reductase [Streptomyces longisporoflavus]|uniref:NAD(P)/FAD-dependent oxidoreductase n=1 Tax=Streptomyces longisporoflavus TaxID=28044 RepID=UPI00199E75E7|nr:FAD/NAD(P)-binding oxidoreductase [Streptomyces longisporoflavus]GGV37161.1 putative ferredoxin reductase [Streptomyces longisporoflavus]
MAPAGIAVVGASLGGLRAAEQLRAAGWRGAITVYGDEPHLPYNRPPLSKEVLAGEAPAAVTTLRRRPSVDDVEWRLGTAVASADLAARTLTLADGSVHGYEGLVAATGVRPRRLPLSGGPPRHVVRTLEDSAALRTELAEGVRVLVVGAGFIGCEVAATARKAGCEVTVVAPEAEPMMLAVGEEPGRVLRRRHEARGVRFRMGRLVAGLTAGGAVLDDGSECAADVVIEAIGSLPNVEWLGAGAVPGQGAGAGPGVGGLDLTDGILCDAHLRIGGLPYAVAVGDVARFPNPRYGALARRVEHWSMPSDCARHAARVLVAGLGSGGGGGGRDGGGAGGGDGGGEHGLAPFAPLPSFWSDQFDVRVQSFGLPGAGDEVRLLAGEPDAGDGGGGGDVVYGYYRGDRLVGVVALGGTRAAALAGGYRGELMALPDEVRKSPVL